MLSRSSWWAAGVFMFLIGGSLAYGQSDLALLLGPEIGKPLTSASLNTTHHFESDLAGQQGDFNLTTGALRLRFKPWYSETTEVLGTLDYSQWDVETGGRLEETGRTVPGELRDLGLGVGFRHQLDNGWMLGSLLQVGSASDKLFDSGDEMYVKALTFLRVPHTDDNAWVFVLAVNTNSELWAAPGFGYLFKKGNWQGGIGIPFLTLFGQPTEKLRIFASYFPVNEVRVDVSYQIVRPLLLFTGFEWTTDRWRRADRRDDDDFLAFDQKRLHAGGRLYLSPDVNFELKGGYAFDREFGEGEDRSDWYDNNLEIEDGWFANLSFTGSF